MATTCVSAPVGSTTSTTASSEAGPVAVVAARGVLYPSLFGRLGLFDPGFHMNARSSAPVIGL